MDDIVASCAADLRPLCPEAGSDALESAASDLVGRWREPGRTYHSLRHLAELLAALGRLAGAGEIEPSDVVVARVAAWFHDAVHGGTPGEDEESSATLALSVLESLGAQTPVAERVAALVLATADHVPTDDPAAPALLDADLWILGAPAVRFDEYCDQVRQEYPGVSDTDYATARLEVLRRLLAHEHLYATAHARAAWEGQARVNLERELARL